MDPTTQENSARFSKPCFLRQNETLTTSPYIVTVSGPSTLSLGDGAPKHTKQWSTVFANR